MDSSAKFYWPTPTPFAPPCLRWWTWKRIHCKSNSLRRVFRTNLIELHHRDLFDEKCVMNSYFGIGIDAKITLDFHMKREEHPEKCRSRARNYMWYGVLGSKEWLQVKYRLLLWSFISNNKLIAHRKRTRTWNREFYWNVMELAYLYRVFKASSCLTFQGLLPWLMRRIFIEVCSINSFMGGTNFWGGNKEDDCFIAPSFDDRVLEVVAVFGSVQMAASRIINLQHHRIAQCHSVKITILGTARDWNFYFELAKLTIWRLGDEGVPVQVDGEAWLQPPGLIRIVHKNRMQMLCRNRVSWLLYYSPGLRSMNLLDRLWSGRWKHGRRSNDIRV